MAGSWTKKQTQAINTKGRDILVAAAAGSGKTAVLVERIIKKITDRENPVDIDRLVVVTFTKAAAFEMKQRIRSELDKLIMTEPDNDRLQTQLTLINNAQITTIDSFCLNIVRNYFADIDIDPGFRTADEGEIKLLENDVMEDMLEDYYASKHEAFYKLADAYCTGRDDSKLVEIILKIYGFARSYPYENEWYEQCLKIYDVKDIADLDGNAAVQYVMQEIKQSLSDYDNIYNKLEDICLSSDGPVMYLAAIQSDHAAIKMMLNAESFDRLTKLVQLLSFDNLGRGGKKDISEEKKEYVKNVRNAYKKYINETVKAKLLIKDAEKTAKDIADNSAAIAMMIKLAMDFSKRMQTEKKNRNIIDFNDMEHMALNVLVKRENGQSIYTEAADTLSDFYQEILIDEYQDSNMLQEVILTAVSKSRRNDGCNNIYMVGDVKQSIYKFRLACPELFIEKYNKYASADEMSTTENAAANSPSEVRIELQTNFRSRENVLESANDVFKRLMNPTYCALEYGEAERLNTGFEYPAPPDNILSNQKVYSVKDFGREGSTDIYLADTNLVNTKDDESNNTDTQNAVNNNAKNDSIAQDLSSRELEANMIADIINDLVNEKDGEKVQLVYDKNVEGGYRKIKYSDIVILTRTVSGWADVFVNTLMARGIPAYSESSEGYFSVREIQLILSYLTVIDNPLQDIPMAAVLLSYFGRFDTEELTIIRAENKKTSLYSQLCKLAEDETETAVHADKANEEDKKITSDKKLAEIKRKAKVFLNKLDEFREKSEMMPIYDLLWDILYETGYYDYTGTMPAGKRRQANLDILLERAAAFENTSYNGLFNFLRYIERLRKFNVDFGEAALLGENENLVRVMSIHKSKGLEFPVVILAGMSKKINQRDAIGELVIDGEIGIGTNVVSLEKRTKSPTIIKAAISRKIMRESISEEMRILYVAMTRAREKLIMTGTLKSVEDGTAKWKQKAVSLAEQKMFSYTDIASMDTYFDMVMPVVYMSQNADTNDLINKGSFRVLEYSVDESLSVVDDKAKHEAQENLDLQEDASFDYSVKEYPFPIDEAKKIKVTVSELKKMQYENDFEEVKLFDTSPKVDSDEAALIEEVQEIKPKFLSDGQEVLVGNERGNAYHRIMECLDYKNISEDIDGSVKEQLAEMIETEKMSRQQADCIRISDIVKFCNSDIGKKVRYAAADNRLWREQPFVFIDEDFDKEQLIQGVIDLYFVEDNKITIVDYKTDRVRRGKEGEEELKRRYTVQLDYYAKALKQLTGLEVSNKVIYSFTLSKEIYV